MPEDEKRLTLGESLKRRCLILAVECVGNLPGAAIDKDAQRTDVEDHVARFLERAMLAYANMTRAAAVADAAAHAPTQSDEAPIFVPCLPAFVATRGEDPSVLVTRAWEAGYRAGVGISRFFRRLDADRVASLEHQQALLSERITVLERGGK
jgi:hypothetical protein